VGDDGRLVVPVAALQALDRGQALGQAVELGRVMVHGLRQVADRLDGVDELGLEPGQTLRERLVPRIEPGQVAHLSGRDRDPLAGTPLLPGEGLRGRRATAGDGLAVPGGLEPNPDLVGLARPDPSRGDLLRLVLGELESPGQLPRIQLEGAEERPVLAPAVDGTCSRRPERRMTAEGVQEVPLPAFVEEPLLVVLAVDLDKTPGDSPSRAAVTGSSSSLAVDRPVADTSRAAISGSGRRSNSAVTRAASAPCRTSVVSARAPIASPRASIRRLFPARSRR
jgi:hypothetical protein